MPQMGMGENEVNYLSRRQRQRALFNEMQTVSNPRDLLAIDRMRRQRGESTQVGDAIRNLALERFKQVDRSIPVPRRDTGGGLFGDIAGLARRAGGAVVEPAIRTAISVTPFAPLQEAEQAFRASSLIDRTTGAPVRGAALDPTNPVRGAITGFRDPSAVPAERVGPIRHVPDWTVIPGTEVGLRDVVAFGADVALDPTVIAGGANVLRKGGGRLLRVGIKSIEDDITEYAIRKAMAGYRATDVEAIYGPLETSTRGILRPARPTPIEHVKVWEWEPPPVPEGHVRLWRGEPIAKGEALPGAAGQFQGRWFTMDRQYAERFSVSPTTGMAGDLKFIDVPASQAEQFRAVPGMGSGQFGEFVLPPELAQQARFAPFVRERFERIGGKATPGAVERATDVPFRPRIAGAEDVPDPPSPVFGDLAGLSPQKGGNRFTAPLLSIEERMDEVRQASNPVARWALTRLGINPSAGELSDVERAIIARVRQEVSAEELTHISVSSALDSHAARWGLGSAAGRSPASVIRIGADGRVRNITAKTEGGSLVWQDVFTKPDAYDLTDAQRAYINDFNRVITEMEGLRVEAGLKPRAKDKSPEGWFYVPRKVDEIRGIAARKGSNPNIQRKFEEAEQGVQRGIRYSTDPRATLEWHVRNAYREIIDHQFAEALAPHSITPRELLQRINPRVVSQVDSAFKEARTAAQRVRELQRQRRSLLVGGEEERAALRGQQRTRRQFIRTELESLREERRQALQFGTPEERRKALQEVREALSRERASLAESRELTSTAARQVREQNRALRTRVERELQRAQEDFTKARNAYNAAKARYSNALQGARQRSVGPGDVFGRSDEEIAIASWRNRFFPQGDAEALNEAFGAFRKRPDQANWGSRALETVGDNVRYHASVGDFAAPFTHGLPFLWRHPIAWSQATVKHYQAFFDPAAQARYIADNTDVFQEMAQHGVPIGDVEFFKAFREGRTIGHAIERVASRSETAQQAVRGVQQQTFGRFQASYDSFLAVARANIWKGLKPRWEKQGGDLSGLARHVRNLTGGLDSRALGVKPSQRATESMWMAFSPRLLRSTVALGGELFSSDALVRRAAWETVASFVTGITGAYIATGIAMGRPWEEIGAGLNPLGGKKFLSYNVNGDWIGVGGQIRALMQLGANVVGNPDSLSEISTDNPIARFYMSRGAPAINITGAALEGLGITDALPYDDVETPIDALKHIGKSAFPFTVQGKLEGEQWPTVGAALIGARTSPQLPFEREEQIRSGIAVREGMVTPEDRGFLTGFREAGEPGGRKTPFDLLAETEGTRAAEAQTRERATPEERAELLRLEQERIEELTRQAPRDPGARFGLITPTMNEHIAERIEDVPENRVRDIVSEETFAARRARELFPDVTEQFGEPRSPVDQQVDEYFGLFEQATQGGEVNSALLEQLEAEFIQKHGIDAYRKVLDNVYAVTGDLHPKHAGLIEAKRELAEPRIDLTADGFGMVSFYDRERVTWGLMQQLVPFLQQYPSYFDWLDTATQQVRGAVEEAGGQPELSQAHAEDLVRAHPIAKGVIDLRTKMRQAWRALIVQRYPDIAKTAVKWGYLDVDRETRIGLELTP